MDKFLNVGFFFGGGDGFGYGTFELEGQGFGYGNPDGNGYGLAPYYGNGEPIEYNGIHSNQFNAKSIFGTPSTTTKRREL
jgi:hypothetical protein